jgi:c(7)-type cytochrome triheme protein
MKQEPTTKQNATAGWRWLVVALVCLGVAISIAIQQKSLAARIDRPDAALEEASQEMDYSKFLHNTQNHARLPCLLCHRREGTAARPALPGANGHLPCAGCHAQQFANNESPMCTICHTDPKSGAVKSFPRLKSFRANFDHARHVSMGNVSCATCHKPARGGVALSIPAGFSAHTICYTCHRPRAQSGGRDISSCGTCHKLGPYSRTPTTSRAFAMNFSHAKHAVREGLKCGDCHDVRAGQPQRRQVTAPQPANHHASANSMSCMTCHNGKRAFGGDDFSVCKRCHSGSSWRF